ncbi:MAG: hypothetical protein RKE49_02115 [Oceanicaulis sp.]
MSRDRERIYIAVIALALITAGFLGVMLWEETRDDDRLILSVGEDRLSATGGEDG